MNRSGMTHKLIFYTFVIASSAPLILLLILAVSASWIYPGLLPDALSPKYLVYVFVSSRRTFGALTESVLISLLVTLLTLTIAIPAARALGLYKFRGKELIKILVLLPLIVPAITITMGIHTSMIRAGLVGKMSGVILIHTVFTLPYAIRLLTDVFEIIGNSCEQQACMLGAGQLRTFRDVTLPLIMPGILSASVMSFIVSFSQYITTFLIGGGNIITLPMLIVPFIQNGEIQVSAVYSLLFVFTTLISLTAIEKLLSKYYRNLKVFYI